MPATMSAMVLSELGPFPDAEGYDLANQLDGEDPLQPFRTKFLVTDPRLIYLDGNSLGRMPVQVPSLVEHLLLQQWGDRLIRSWNEGWWELQLKLGDLLATILGASPGEVVISDSTSVNLYKMALAALDALPGRTKIVTDDLNFPSDLYILEGIARQSGRELVIVESDGVNGPLQRLEETIDDSTALVSLSHTTFKSGFTYDMREVTAMASKKGALMLWDCSHSAGVVPIRLNGDGIDLAIGCTYKYLNGGPGSPAFIYVRSELQEQLTNPITAWWGHAEPFEFKQGFEPVSGIRRFHTGTMPILSLAAIEPGLRDVANAGVDAIRLKSVGLSDYLIDQWRVHLQPLGFELASPASWEMRGSHVSFGHVEAWPITRALIDIGQVIPDFRAPDNLRLGLAPLYTTYLEVHTAVQRLKVIVGNGLHEEFSGARAAVT